MLATGAITDGVAATTDSGCSRNSWGCCCWVVVGYPCAVEKVFVLFCFDFCEYLNAKEVGDP